VALEASEAHARFSVTLFGDSDVDAYGEQLDFISGHVTRLL
jgi:hypothetical protein